MNVGSEHRVGTGGTQHVTSADIVILGAGYGGLHVAQRLTTLLRGKRRTDGKPWSLLIVDRRSSHQLTTELPRLLGNEVADSDLAIPLDHLLSEQHNQFFQGDILTLHLETKDAPGWIDTSVGRVGYRFLVIALGSVSNDFGIPGVREHMQPFLTTDDAHDLRVAVAHSIQDAARLELDQREADIHDLQRRMTVLIGGAGATGVEIAGELAEFTEKQWRSAWHVAGEPATYRLPKPQIMLVGAAPTVLPGWSDQAIQAVTNELQALHVELRLHTPITKAEPGRVQLKGGEWIAADTLVWTGGVRALKLLQEAGLPTGSSGRVIVDQFQRVAEHPTLYAVGDSALLLAKSGRPVPPTADIALRSGETAARALADTIQGRNPQHVLQPMMRNAVSVGRHFGATNLLGVKLKGQPARTIKALIEWEYRQSITRLHGYSPATLV